MAENDSRDIRRYYFNLYLWTQISRQFRAFSGVEAHTIHRSLVDEASGDFSPRTIHAILGARIAGLSPIEALDAGCGYGGTCLELHERLGGRWLGVTLSQAQVAIARRNAAAMRKDGAVTFRRQSYDDPFDGDFNLIYCIESLIHAPDPARSLRNLAASLRPGGLFIIVDDMPAEPFPDAFAEDLAEFGRLWRCPAMASVRRIGDYLNSAGCVVEEVRDLTGLMRPRDETSIALAIADIRKRAWRRRLVGLQSVTDAEIGGLLLERLGRNGSVRYQMIVARKM